MKIAFRHRFAVGRRVFVAPGFNTGDSRHGWPLSWDSGYDCACRHSNGKEAASEKDVNSVLAAQRDKSLELLRDAPGAGIAVVQQNPKAILRVLALFQPH